MTRAIAFLLVLFWCFSVYSQRPDTLCNDPVQTIKDITALRQDPGWYRIQIYNPSDEAGSYSVKILPNLDNTLYYYDANAGKWIGNRSGILVPATNHRTNPPINTCILRAHTLNTLYAKIDAGTPVIKLEKSEVATHEEQTIRITWITSLAVLLLFIVNTAYIYFSLKDRTVLYFLIMQIGGLIFITAYKGLFSILLPNHIFTIGQTGGTFIPYNLNSLFLHLSILILFYGLIHFCRRYLDTPNNFPGLDRLLRRGINTFLGISLTLCIVNTCYYIENYSWYFDNIGTGLLAPLVLFTSIRGYSRKLPAAGSFLIAISLTLVFIIATALFHIIGDVQNMAYTPLKSFLPDLAIIAETIGFSIALVTYTRLLQTTLSAKETEARQLEFDLRELEFRHQLIRQENLAIGTEIQQHKTQNSQIQEKLDTNQRELASLSLHMAQKNELLARLKNQIKEIKIHSSGHKQLQLDQVESLLQSDVRLDDEWTKFKLHFEQVHPDFFEALKIQHPTLTNNEVRLCAYFHMNLSTKEIAALLIIDPASVRRAKTRLFKKIGRTAVD